MPEPRPGRAGAPNYNRGRIFNPGGAGAPKRWRLFDPHPLFLLYILQELCMSPDRVVRRGEYWRLFTGPLLHRDLMVRLPLASLRRLSCTRS